MTAKDFDRLPYGPIDRCQSCYGRRLEPVLNLGYLPPVNRMRAVGASFDEEPWFPAEMVACRTCHLAQLAFAADPSLIFPPDYPYTSGTTRILRENFADLARKVGARIALSPSDLVVDVGSNDGTLLSNFRGHRVVGIEPSLAAELAEARGIRTYMRFFDDAAVEAVLRDHGTAKVVTATNVFAHIHNIHDVVANVLRLLTPDGTFVTESHYLGSLVETLQYDTIYHEHLRYYSLTSLQYLLDLHGLRVVDVERIPTHGGSIRVYATPEADAVVRPAVSALLREEASAGIANEAWAPGFRERVRRSKFDLLGLLAPIARRGETVYGVGAPSRASTLIAYTGLDEGVVDCVLEVDASKKVGKYMPGTRIPVVAESRLFQRPPPYVLLLSWHISDELMRALKAKGYRGDFIVPLPTPRVVPNADV